MPIRVARPPRGWTTVNLQGGLTRDWSEPLELNQRAASNYAVAGKIGLKFRSQSGGVEPLGTVDIFDVGNRVSDTGKCLVAVGVNIVGFQCRY